MSRSESGKTSAKATHKRVVVERYDGPEVLKVIEEKVPEPGPGEVRVRVLATGVSFTDALIRAGSYFGAPTPPFTPGYELVGTVEALGPGCTRLHEGDRVGALTVWGGNAECVCLAEEEAYEVPEDLDPAEIVSLLFSAMTAYQCMHRIAMVKPGETMLVHGAAGRVGIAALELGVVAGLKLIGTASARDRAAVERLGAVAIDYRNEDFVQRVREMPEKGVDVVLDGLGGVLSLRSFRVLRPGGRLVVFGHYDAMVQGRKSRRGWMKWCVATGALLLKSVLSPRRKVLAYRIQKLHKGPPPPGRAPGARPGGAPRYPEWFREDLGAMLGLLRSGKIHAPVSERLPLTEARRAHELLQSTASKGKLVLVP